MGSKKSNSVNLSSVQRLELYAKHNGRCFYCESKIHYNRMTVDHVTAKSRGGVSNLNNYVCSCEDCNNGKGSMSIESFDKFIDGIYHILRNQLLFRLFCRHYKITIRRKSKSFKGKFEES